MRFRLKTTFWWIVIVIMIIAIILLCRACFASFKKADSAKEEKVTTTTTTTTAEEVKLEEEMTTATTTTTAEEVKQEEESTTVTATTVEDDNEKIGEEESVKQYGVDDPDATELIAYLGERPVSMQEIPTFDSYLKSQEKAFILNYKGTNHWENNDSRRLYFKVPVESITEEYEDDGQIRESTVELEEIEPGLIRATPIHSTEGRTYVTFKINSDGKTYYMTWVPLIE